MNRRSIAALARRDLTRSFANPIGYVFITVFIFLSAAAAFWRPRFFLNNLATLDQLNALFPWLLLFFVPALTMGAWADERKQGTDELLLTLPATDLEIVLGKFLSVVGVYSIALVLSLSHVGVLMWLGDPDLGVLAGAYLGYWLAGTALIAVAMIGSLGTANLALAFVAGVAICSMPVAIGEIARLSGGTAMRLAAPVALEHHFAQLAGGVVSLAAVAYFAGLCGVGLFVNVLLISKRHWSGDAHRRQMALHGSVRAASTIAAWLALTIIATRVDVRLDITAERLHSFSAETKQLLRALPDRRVTIRAFVSPEVPEEYVQERETLLNVLQELRAFAPSTLDVVVEDTQPYSDAARIARERFGIVPRLVADAGSGSGETRPVFLGVACTSGPDEQVIPFFGHGVTAEYELTRAIRVVAQASRKRIGIVDTDAKVSGGVDYDDRRSRVPWAIVDELRKQYEVVTITPWEPIEEKVDALLVVLPSTLLQHELKHTMDAIRAGTPALLVVDPLPAMDLRLAPAAAMAERSNPYATGQSIVRKNVGDIQQALASLGVAWAPTRVAWDSYRPHAEAAQLPREIIFAGPGSGNPGAIAAGSPMSSGVQELVLMYSGVLTPATARGVSFEPLVATGSIAGTLGYFQLVRPTPAGPVLDVNAPHESEGVPLTLAAHVRGQTESGTTNVVVVADLDFVSDRFFAMRDQTTSSSRFDNVTFFLNAIDVLAGDEAFLGLRKRRVRYRTLDRVEAATRTFLERRSEEERQAAADADAALNEARSRVDARAKEIVGRQDLDEQSKQVLIRNLEETENRKLSILRVNVEQARDARIQATRESMESQVQRIRSTIRLIAVAAPPLPVLALGLGVFLRQRRREREGAAAMRRVRTDFD